MSFKQIHLPDALLAGLYKDGLVVIPGEINIKDKAIVENNNAAAGELKPVSKTVAKTPDDNSSKPMSYLGNNKKNISIIVKDEKAIHLQDELLDILSAILTACKLNLADVAIINTHQQQVHDTILRNELKPTSVLLFGIETADIGLPFSIPCHKIQQFNNCAYLQAASLEQMKGNSTEAKLEKSKLWVCLKTLFGV